ncbi:MAG: hypothetical protein D8M57_13245 [Candidatus Scalindua sp. AMX11]|nr:MAG: hypothetical protein DWQ00_11845 [Candidatus Scalindua sp.]NOG83759.1 hypothetical protein [Planctomycetota bacterium]RZV82918.1 MAG: hypothetical protein EX341_09000 [Candidatus Scalindua sp. SCAELEC01]TDE64460.1 MAG: hypothetical protein D8M57_13245 [Candidatus Scalindua sp. AMX11]GJQ59789.1 MAG: hypothetical protein SCALA701_25900 [Candidatus Scalindua sp.]
MAIKFVEIIPSSGPLGTQIINFADAPAGLTFSRDHQRPMAPRRTQDGTLVTQTLRYNKKVITLTGTLYEIDIHTYLESLFEAGITATLKLWYEATGTYTETADFNSTVLLTAYEDNHDKISNIRTFTATFTEV